MPVIEPHYLPPPWLTNGHVQTILARSVRRLPVPSYRRRRIKLEDEDFIDLDEVDQGNRRVAIILHGLESSSLAPYVRGMAKILLGNGWDIVAMNFRGCSGEPNRTLRSYHSGVTDDLHAVIDDVHRRRPTDSIALVGFSLGGNVALRYLGEHGAAVQNHGIAAAAVISVPCDLEACADRLALPSNRFYMNRFLRYLFRKVRDRQQAFPDALDYAAVLASRDFHDFDGRFTAPVHGFDSAQDYWMRCSSKAVVEQITVPTLCINALDDPFLSRSCHLFDEARNHSYFHVEVPEHGGHVGFINFGDKGYYHERRVREFFHEQLGS